MHFSPIFLGISLILFSESLYVHTSFKNKKEQKKHEEIEFHNSIQD